MNNIDHTSRLHARFGPSSAKRWVNCPASVRLQEEYAHILGPIEARKDKSAAEEGTQAHEALEEYLRNAVIIDGTPPEMAEHVRWASDIVDSLDNEEKEVLVEHRVKLTDDIWGTADCIIYTAERKWGRELDVIDFKYGRSPVDAEYNYQLGLYALAFLSETAERWERLSDWKVRLHILQPRCGRGEERRVHSVWEAPTEWLKLLKMDAIKSSGWVETAFPNLGDHCDFCPASGVCPAKAKEVIADFDAIDEIQSQKEKETPNLSQIAALVTRRKAIIDWLDDAELLLLEALSRDSNSCPGYSTKLGIKKRAYNPQLKLPKIKEILLDMGIEENNFLKVEEKLLPISTLLAKVPEDELREKGILVDQQSKSSIVKQDCDFSEVKE